MKILDEMKTQIAAPQNQNPQPNFIEENSENLPRFSGNLTDRSFEMETNQRANPSAAHESRTNFFARSVVYKMGRQFYFVGSTG